MKAIIRPFAGVLIGIVAGLVIAAAITVAFTDTTLTEFRDRIISTYGEVKSDLVIMRWRLEGQNPSISSRG